MRRNKKAESIEKLDSNIYYVNQFDIVTLPDDTTGENLINNFTQQVNSNNMNNIYKYKILNAGSIEPKAWIKEQMHHDLIYGYIGHYDKVHPTVTHNVFIKQDSLGKRRFSLRKEWWSGEHEGYWKDAIIRMAFLTGNKEYINKSKGWINELKEITQKDNYIGIYKKGREVGCRFNHEKGNGELWTSSRILMAMLAYYEFTGDKDVLETVEKAAKLIMKHYKAENYFSVNAQGGGISHGIGFFENLEWLYRITGNKEYLDFSVKLYEDFNKGNVRDDDLKIQNLLKEFNLFENHGAHIAEGLFVPEFIASIQNEKKLIEAAENVIRKLKVHLTPGGAMRCDEWIKGREGTADERYEYCGITEMISPLNKMISFTGNLNLANQIETMVFNAGQGARFPVLSAVSYLTSDNRIRIKKFELLKRESYDAAHFAAACCALNAGRLMPYYVEGMWMKTIDDDGIVAVLFGPSKVKTSIHNIAVEITEETDYPFSDEIIFTVTPFEPLKFSLIIRKPHACQNVDVELLSKAEITETDDIISIDKIWEKGDKLYVKFNFEIQRINQPASKTVENKGVYFKRGALVYALAFDHKIKAVKEYQNSGFHRYKITANDSKQWKLRINTKDKFKFIHIINSDIQHPWDKPVVKLEGILRDKKNQKKSVDLIPMGNTIFRRVTFSK
ncbi:MAG: glycoside hydrolase family 127 protein [Bacteroidales bacterium]|nr:glycoside hydrolase family 127 protein [Bacteroidales bacterium]